MDISREFKATTNKMSMRLNRLRIESELGLMPQYKEGRKVARTLTGVLLSKEDREALQNLAEQFGWQWNGKGNVTNLVAAIAQGLLVLTYNSELFEAPEFLPIDND